jgi:hypothetical protein
MTTVFFPTAQTIPQQLIHLQVARTHAPGLFLVLIEALQTLVSQEDDAGTSSKIYRSDQSSITLNIKLVPAIRLQYA